MLEIHSVIFVIIFAKSSILDVCQGGQLKGGVGGGEGVWKMFPDPAITNLYQTKKFNLKLYWIPTLKSMEFAWDIPNVTFEWIKIQR